MLLPSVKVVAVAVDVVYDYEAWCYYNCCCKTMLIFSLVHHSVTFSRIIFKLTVSVLIDILRI
jgi:hypothetical protein